MAHVDYRDVSYGDRGGDQRSYFQNGPVFDANFNDDYFAMKSNKDISKSGDMDTVTIFNKPGDPLLDGYNEDALNEPIPEAYPQLTTEQEDFAAKAAEIVQQFATIFPQGPADVPLTELLKQFSGVPLEPKVIDAINHKMQEWYQTHPDEYPVRLGMSAMTGDIYLGLPNSSGRFEPVFRLNGNNEDRLEPG